MAGKKFSFVPTNLEEAAQVLAVLGRVKQQHDALVEKTRAKVAKINKKKEKVIEEASAVAMEQIKAYAEIQTDLKKFAEEYRKNLGSKKTIHLRTGELLWKLGNPILIEEDLKKAIEFMKKDKGLQKYLKTDIRKKDLLKNKELIEKIPGLSVSQKERFYAQPSAAIRRRSRAAKKEKEKI